jgi:hypothetical protein
MDHSIDRRAARCRFIADGFGRCHSCDQRDAVTDSGADGNAGPN